jgi:hypothetical protein
VTVRQLLKPFLGHVGASSSHDSRCRVLPWQAS